MGVLSSLDVLVGGVEHLEKEVVMIPKSTQPIKKRKEKKFL